MPHSGHADFNWRKSARTVLTRFPALMETGFELQRIIRRIQRKAFDPDFQLLRAMQVAPGRQLVDVGANRGQSIDAMRLFQPEGEIVAFEPNPILAARLRNRLKSRTHLNIHPVGLSDEDGEFELFIPTYRGFEFDGLASFDLESAREWLVTKTVNFDPSKLSVKKYTCSVKKLDDFGLSPEFIKIDVQGLEVNVINGGSKTIELFRPILLIETGGEWTMPEIMRDLGYLRGRYHEGILSVGQGHGRNTFFFPDGFLDKLDKRYVTIEV